MIMGSPFVFTKGKNKFQMEYRSTLNELNVNKNIHIKNKNHKILKENGGR